MPETTSAQAALIEALVEALHADPRIEAAWLAGSLASGTGDEFSDVDVLVLVPDGLYEEVAAAYGADVGAIAEAVLVNALFGGAVVSVVTADWQRFDLSFVRREQLQRYDGAKLRLLFNKGGASPPAHPKTPYAPAPAKVEAMAKEFFRVLGLLGVVLGREEYVVAVSGVELQRRALIELMVEINRVPPEDRGGALHLRRVLSPEQHRQLAELPAVRAERGSILEANLAIARLYLPLARRLAEEVGASWPQALEDAARRRLRAVAGLEL